MSNKTIVLGVTGGIAAYKACELASRLTQSGARVSVVMTQSAQKFVAPLTFQALTHQPVHTSLWQGEESQRGESESKFAAPDHFAAMAHIALADSADVILIAPASANILAKLAHGIADDLLTTIVLATRAPVLLSPAMNPQMLANAATQRNLEILRGLGFTIIEPESGRMACEHIGSGRLPQSEILIQALREALTPATQDFAAKTVLVTAGPTRENIDPVRYISNRSSGKMGFAIASECARRGAKVHLVCGPTNLSAPRDVEKIDVTTTQEMLDAATKLAPRCDVIIAAAAPADYSVPSIANHKLKKSTPKLGRTLELVETPDILATIGKAKTPNQIVIGFAAETENLLDNAREKLKRKNCDAIVANDVSQSDAGFDVDTNRVTWVSRDESCEWPLMQKSEVAARICDKIARLQSRDEL